jgi:hypothetical protein
VTLRLSKDSYAVGEPVEMTVMIENTSKRPITYTQNNGQMFDLFVIHDENYIWGYGYGRVFTAAVREHTLGPGENESATDAWGQQVCSRDGTVSGGTAAPPGTYVAQGLWMERQVGWYSNRVEFSIRP